MQIKELEIRNYRLFRDIKLSDLPRLDGHRRCEWLW